tara:strand:+ start:337 stop:579 length:243 start_codon:yes stop_codon:yes gene_type:complete
MPNDNAIFPEITLVITKVIIGRIVSVAVWLKVFIQFCPKKIKRNLAIVERRIKMATAKKLSISTPKNSGDITLNIFKTLI